MSEIKKVTLNELAKLDTWKIRDVDRKTFLLIANKINYKHTSGFPYDDNEFLSIYNYESKDVTWSARDDGYFNRHDHSEVQLIEENEVKKVDLQYLLDNDKWQLKVTPEQSEMVQLALFDVGCFWGTDKSKAISNTNASWIERDVNFIYYGNSFNDKLLELEEQTPQNDFKTQQDVWAWLGGGYKIQFKASNGLGLVLRIKDGFLCDDKDIKVKLSLCKPQNWKKVTNWYDKLDGTVENGRFCWVSQCINGDMKNIVLINDIKTIGGNYIAPNAKTAVYMVYICGDVDYYEATPLTNNEIKAFMVGGSDE